MIPAPIEARCSFCFAVTDGSEHCSEACAQLSREYDEGVVVYLMLRVVTDEMVVAS